MKISSLLMLLAKGGLELYISKLHSTSSLFCWPGFFFWKKLCRNSQEGKGKSYGKRVKISLHSITLHLTLPSNFKFRNRTFYYFFYFCFLEILFLLALSTRNKALLLTHSCHDSLLYTVAQMLWCFSRGCFCQSPCFCMSPCFSWVFYPSVSSLEKHLSSDDDHTRKRMQGLVQWNGRSGDKTDDRLRSCRWWCSGVYQRLCDNGPEIRMRLLSESGW